MSRAVLVLCVLPLAGCVSAGRAQLLPDAQADHATTEPPPDLRSLIVQRARSLIGVRSLTQISTDVPDDCTGFVRLVYGSVGIELMGYGARKDNGVTAIWRGAEAKGALVKEWPEPGDLVFFKETYDRNRDGRRDDGLTHVGIIEAVEPDGTILFVHRAGHGVEESRFNPRTPHERFASDGHLVNDYLRAATRKRRAYLAGELWAGAASAQALR